MYRVGILPVFKGVRFCITYVLYSCNFAPWTFALEFLVKLSANGQVQCNFRRSYLGKVI